MHSPRFASTLIGLAVSIAASVAIAHPLAAQDAPEPAESATTETVAPTAAAPPAARPAAPIMVVVTTAGRVPDEASAAVSQALVEQVTTMADGRPVHALGAPELRDAIAACEDDACIGGQLAQAGAQAGVIARLRARARRPFEVSIELRDPVSGAHRLPALAGELPLDPAAIPAATAALVEPLRAAMPAPPPPPATILVTVNVDGARVTIDGQEIGTSPVGPVEVSEGTHEIVVTASGYASVRRQERITAGEQARVDATLQSISAQAAAAAADGSAWVTTGGDEQPAETDLLSEWWFWTAIGAGAALVIGVAIGIGVAVSSEGDDGMVQLPDPRGIPLPHLMGGL